MASKLEVEKYKKALLAEKRRLERERHLHAEEEAEHAGDLADYDNHPADAASETYERTKNLALDENFKDIIERIDEALRKIEGGSYGLCDRCGQQIGVERLKAIPYATFCINCQEAVEIR